MQPSPTLGKDLVGLETLTAEQIRGILDTAEPFKEISERQIKKVPVLRGKTIVNLFFEPSTRTSTTFELAAKRLSADILSLNLSTSSTSKGESLLDTAVRYAEERHWDVVPKACAAYRARTKGKDENGVEVALPPGQSDRFVVLFDAILKGCRDVGEREGSENQVAGSRAVLYLALFPTAVFLIAPVSSSSLCPVAAAIADG